MEEYLFGTGVKSVFRLPKELGGGFSPPNCAPGLCLDGTLESALFLGGSATQHGTEVSVLEHTRWAESTGSTRTPAQTPDTPVLQKPWLVSSWIYQGRYRQTLRPKHARQSFVLSLRRDQKETMRRLSRSCPGFLIKTVFPLQCFGKVNVDGGDDGEEDDDDI